MRANSTGSCAISTSSAGTQGARRCATVGISPTLAVDATAMVSACRSRKPRPQSSSAATVFSKLGASALSAIARTAQRLASMATGNACSNAAGVAWS